MDEKSEVLDIGGLLQFLPESMENLRVLVVESCLYLPELRRRMPRAELYAVVADADIAAMSEYAGLDVSWQILDYHETPLPYEKEFFDYILSERCLELAANPQDIAAGFGTYIKQTGFLLTSFQNIRHWKVLRDLMEGHFYAVVSRWFAKPEMVKLLYASFYKDAVFRPQRSPAPKELLQKLIACGFDNSFHDIDTEVWLVKAARSTPEISMLKSFFTPEIRRQLVTFLRRIEYDIDVEMNCQRFWQLYKEAGLFPDYLAEFIWETIVHRRNVFAALQASAPDTALLAEIFQAAEDRCTKEADMKMLLGLEEDGEKDER